MKHRLLAILLAFVIVFGFAAAVPAQAAHAPALPQAVRSADFGDTAQASAGGATVMNANAFNYLADFCKTNGEADEDGYYLSVEIPAEDGKYIDLFLAYNQSSNEILVSAATFGYGMNEYLAVIDIRYPGTVPFRELLVYSSDGTPVSVGLAYLTAAYIPGDAVKFQSASFNSDFDREKCEAYNTDCCALMIDFLQNLLVEGGYSVKDLGFVLADRYYMPFTDVNPDDFYYRAVRWAVDEKITAGVSATSFAPDDVCTRSQVVTFLWREAGSPDPVSANSRFVDVDPNAWYGKAVLWAVEQGITVGVNANHFAPDAECTRSQIVTFLWRYAKSPAPSSTTSPFSDVQMDDWYAKPVLWAVEQGITLGVGGSRFAPDDPCTRGQVVTFLWRQAGQPIV